MATQTEENYIKAIYKIQEREHKSVSTNAISRAMQTTAASVTDMLKRLSQQGLVNYEKYKGVSLTEGGKTLATQLIRKHRLWEVFLVEKLGFKWDEVHEIAEEMEHINSDELTNRLEAYLKFPRYDPHGDPIPSAEGKITLRKQMPLIDQKEDTPSVVVGVREHSDPFLRHLNDLGIGIDTELTILEKMEYDKSMKLQLREKSVLLSAQVARNILVKSREL